tara:strand:- start:6146 stop:7294 length:1149 start_codon:yes stop_codon:yes gene_type:complete
MENKQNNQIEEVKNWDTVTKWILGVAIFFIVFSIIAPAIFVNKAIVPGVDFSKTGQVGDTIGGIMNPFIALVGILLTFLAFYMQIKANQIQKQLFLDGLRAEKEKDEELERKDAEYKLSLLVSDLEIIQKDISDKAQKIKDFFEAERNKPFDANLLFRTAMNRYTRILDLDRLSIYKGFKLFLSANKQWLKSFNRLYSALDYLPQFFEQVYTIYDNHAKTKFDKKQVVTKDLRKLIDDGSELLTDYKTKFPPNEYLEQPASKTVNESIRDYHKIIDESYDEQGNMIKETDFMKLKDDMLLPLITKILEQREKPETFERKLESIGQQAANIRTQIAMIEKESIWFSNNVEEQYNMLMVDKGDDKSTKTVIKEIHDFISDGLKG